MDKTTSQENRLFVQEKNHSAFLPKSRNSCDNILFCNRDRFIALGLTISTLRKMQSMSQEKLAVRAKISRSHLSSIEAPNIMRCFSVEVLYHIADALGLPAGDLLNYSSWLK